jgi:hypothetical protein
VMGVDVRSKLVWSSNTKMLKQAIGAACMLLLIGNEAWPSPKVRSRMTDFSSYTRVRVSFDEARRHRDAPRPLPFVSAEVSDSDIKVTGIIANATDKAAVLYFGNAGASGEPFEASLLVSQDIKPRATESVYPAIPALCFKLTLPAHVEMRFSQLIDLSNYDYKGSPEGIVAWTIVYTNQMRSAEPSQGRVAVKLPRR